MTFFSVELFIKIAKNPYPNTYFSMPLINMHMMTTIQRHNISPQNKQLFINFINVFRHLTIISNRNVKYRDWMRQETSTME